MLSSPKHFVCIAAAGVFGTTEILFQSQMRGLKLSERLGSGFSCNGNTVAYVAGSPAPLGAYGLDSEQLSKISFQERPGPAISSSYTSSLGFTIQVEAFYSIKITLSLFFPYEFVIHVKVGKLPVGLRFLCLLSVRAFTGDMNIKLKMVSKAQMQLL